MTEKSYGERYKDEMDKQMTHNNQANEQVDHPAHYGGKDNPYETIRVIEAWGMNFNRGNALKYLSRAGKKQPSSRESAITDLEKAIWYLQREVNSLKGYPEKAQGAIAGSGIGIGISSQLGAGRTGVNFDAEQLKQEHAEQLKRQRTNRD